MVQGKFKNIYDRLHKSFILNLNVLYQLIRFPYKVSCTVLYRYFYNNFFLNILNDPNFPPYFIIL